jgi:hypothetical protein
VYLVPGQDGLGHLLIFVKPLLVKRNLSMKIGHMISKFNVYSDWQRFSFVV